MLQTTPTNPAALARRPDTAGPLAVATPTTRRLADASISRNTRRAYLGALRRLDAWRGAAPVDDASLAAYLGAIFEAGRAPATAALAVAAVRFRAKLAGQPAPAGEATARVLGGFRRTAADRGRGRLDAVIASLLFMGGLRRSEVSALEWRDVSDARDGDGVLLTGREPTPTAAPGGRAGRHRFLNVLPHLDTPPARTLSQSSVQENPRAQEFALTPAA